MNNIAVLPRALGVLYFYSPESDLAKDVYNDLTCLVDAYHWQDHAKAESLVQAMQLELGTATKYSFSVLFEGQGELIAPPWGSVYQTKDNLIMGDSTEAYCEFLHRVGIEMDIPNQPLDHFGLMMWTLASLTEEGDQVAMIELLSVHLLPWAYRYLELLSSTKESPFYVNLAGLTAEFLKNIQYDMGLELQPTKLYK
ncbi:MAG: molecular chaperone [Moritella sp.]|uniref:molecular chaperone n=1 Tax=Moritella sp. TaxID=78556 RepID=UPI0029B27C62|nr:molecular chaperone [Moritella sp.]MDX2320027.1 molecular chaperone [Moritella sp.]